jgi:tetratricopeptide (TPR) repeat protein
MMHQETIRDKEIFVGRQKELGKITSFLNTPVDEVQPGLAYIADGGTGKTILLDRTIQNFSSLVNKRKTLPLLALPTLIDFYHLGNRTKAGLVHTIVSAIAQWNVEELRAEVAELKLNEYLERVRLLRQKWVADEWDALEEAYYEIIDRLTEKHLLVLFFDTFEVSRGAGRWLLDAMLPKCKGKVKVLIGSRPTPKKFLEKAQVVEHAKLSSLEDEDIEEFLTKLKVTVPPSQLSQLIKYTRRRPILIALAADWLLRGHEMSEMPGKAIPETFASFEAALVSKIKDLKYPDNQLVQYMAHAHHRFDNKLLGTITEQKGQLDEHKRSLEKLTGYSFIKHRSGLGGMPDSYVLHDEMRDMVQKYIWKKDDNEGVDRADISVKAIGYYDELLSSDHPELRFIKSELEIERLYHLLFAAPQKNAKRLWQLADNVHNANDTDYLEILIEEAKTVLRQRFVPDQTLEHLLSILEGWLKIDTAKEPAENEEAKKLYTALHPQIREFRALGSLLLGLGTIEGRLGNYPKAREHYEDGIALYQNGLDGASEYHQDYLPVSKEEMLQEQAELYKSIGYTYRRHGEWIQAQEYYEKGLKVHEKLQEVASSPTEYQGAYAALLNNLGFVYRVEGELKEAHSACSIALDIREEEGAPFPISLTHNTIGLIYRDERRYKFALEHFYGALDLLEDVSFNPRTNALQARVLRNIGSVYLDEGNLEDALKYLQQSHALSVPIEEPNTENKLGRAYLMKGDLDKAEAYFQDSIKDARQQNDAHLLMDSLVQVALLKGRQDDISGLDKYKEQVQELVEKGHHFNYHLGTLARGIGDLHTKNNRYVEAFQYYAEALVYWGKFAKFKYDDLFDELVEIMPKVPRGDITKCADILLTAWETDTFLNKNHPEVRRFAVRWKKRAQ